jgi:Tol biopolymer transport system component
MRFLISPDVNSIALCTFNAAVIWNVNLKNGDRQQIGAEMGCNKQYAWRSQSQQIFYLRETPPGTGVGAVVSVDVNSNQVEVIVPDRVSYFTLSPDGRYLAYTQENTQKAWSLWIMELAASHAVQIASGQIGQLFWSSDSTHLLYGILIEEKNQPPPTGGYLLTYQVATGKHAQITPEFKHLGAALWSPDSRWIAFTAAKELSQDMQVYLVSANDGQLRPAGVGAGFSYPIAWSPQGDSLLFINRIPDKENEDGLWRHDLDQDTNTLFAQGSFDNAVYSPDGKKVAVFQQDNRLLVFPAQGGSGLNIAEQVAEGDSLPSFQWLSSTDLAYLQLAGAIQIQSVP